MPIDREGNAYREGRHAWADGKLLSDKPAHFLLGEWEAGWHDAMAGAVRALAKPAAKA